MMNINKLMKVSLFEETNETSYLAKMIVSDTKLVHDCLIYDKDGRIDEARIDFDRILMMHGDRTGYEVSCNEIRLEKDMLKKSLFFSFLIGLDIEINKKFSKKVVIYLQELDDTLDVRFHSLRENEKMWLSDDLDVYDHPIIKYIS